MKIFFFIALFFINTLAFAQEAEVAKELKNFHQMLVTQDFFLHKKVHEKISYGHSSGWIETRRELLGNLANGYTKYYSYKEDSLAVVVNKDVAHARFLADIDVSVNGVRGLYRLRVLEVWIKQKRKWYLFARQAIKA